MPTELHVTVKDEESKKLTKKFLIYEDYELKHGNKVIEQSVKELLDEFQGEAQDINITAKMVYR
jgi:tyrosyl-tRNA synthetase